MSVAQASGEVVTVTRDGAASALAGLTRVVSVVFILALPMLVIGTNLRSLVNDRQLMVDGFMREGVDQVTGLDEPQLARVADQLGTYLSSATRSRLDIQVTLNGQQRALFNTRELDHMEDVQALIQVFLGAQVIAAGLVVLRLLWALGVERGSRRLGRDMLLSSGLIAVLVAVVGALSFTDFEWLWLQFHRIAFRNNLWLLDPRTDYLIMLFPEPMWFVYTIRMAVGVAAATVAIALGGFFAGRFAPR